MQKSTNFMSDLKLLQKRGSFINPLLSLRDTGRAHNGVPHKFLTSYSYLFIHFKSEDQWAVSSTWLEHLAFNQRVAGSKVTMSG